MKTFLAQNQFISNPSVTSEPPTEVSTADSACRLQNVARPDATAERDPHPNSVSFVSMDLITEHARSAVASSDLQPRATAEQIHSSCDGVENRATSDNTKRQERVAGLEVRSATIQRRVSPSGSHEAIPSNEGRPQETPASAPTKNPDVGILADIDCINEIFFYARKLMKQPPRFVLDEPAFMAEVEEVPLFIREDGYLKRQA